MYGGREVLTMRKDAGQTAADCRSACVSGEEGGGSLIRAVISDHNRHK